MKILLVVPGVKTFYGKPRYPQLGIAMIGAVLLCARHDVHAIDMRLSPGEDDILLNALQEHRPDLVGFSVTNWDFLNALHLAKAVKDFNKDITTLFGGPQPTLCPQETMANPEIDIVLTGEGENTVVELAEKLEHHAPIADVKGILYRDHGQIITTGPRPLHEDLSTLPWPAYELFDLKAYQAGREKRMGIYTTRGCPYGCTFCTGKKPSWDGESVSVLRLMW